MEKPITTSTMQPTHNPPETWKKLYSTFSMYNYNKTSSHSRILDDIVTGNSRTTMSTQLQPDRPVMMKTTAQDNFITRTNRLRLHVQVQLLQPAPHTW